LLGFFRKCTGLKTLLMSCERDGWTNVDISPETAECVKTRNLLRELAGKQSTADDPRFRLVETIIGKYEKAMDIEFDFETLDVEEGRSVSGSKAPSGYRVLIEQTSCEKFLWPPSKEGENVKGWISISSTWEETADG
jgi:hypothetical protein